MNSCTSIVKILLPARETLSAHNFCELFTEAASQSGSGSGLSFWNQKKKILLHCPRCRTRRSLGNYSGEAKFCLLTIRTLIRFFSMRDFWSSFKVDAKEREQRKQENTRVIILYHFQIPEDYLIISATFAAKILPWFWSIADVIANLCLDSTDEFYLKTKRTCTLNGKKKARSQALPWHASFLGNGFTWIINLLLEPLPAVVLLRHIFIALRTRPEGSKTRISENCLLIIPRNSLIGQ